MNQDQLFIKGITKAVQDRGDEYVYPEHLMAQYECLYVANGQPACIVGQALVNCGVPIGRLMSVEGRDANDVIPEFLSVTPELTGAALQAQIVQDEGGTWGEALGFFRRYLDEVTGSVLDSS